MRKFSSVSHCSNGLLIALFLLFSVFVSGMVTAQDDLKSAKTLTIQVTNDAGKSIGGAMVNMRSNSLPIGAIQVVEGETVSQFDRTRQVRCTDEGKMVVLFENLKSELFIQVNNQFVGSCNLTWDGTKDTTLVAKLKPSSFSGAVVDTDGNAITDVLVNPKPLLVSMEPGDPFWADRTNEVGEFFLAHVGRDVTFSHPDYCFGWFKTGRNGFDFENRKAGDPDRIQKIILEKGLELTGEVKREDGSPIRGALVLLHGQYKRSTIQDNPKQMMQTAGIPTRHSTRTEKDGKFRFRCGVKGRATIVVVASGYALDTEKLKIGNQPNSLDFTLKPSKGLKVQVVNEDREPVGHCLVKLDAWRDFRMMAMLRVPVSGYTDENGQWEWKEAPIDEFKLKIGGPNQKHLQPTKTESLKGGDEILVELKKRKPIGKKPEQLDRSDGKKIG